MPKQQNIIGRGAEAILTKEGNKVLKDRIKKSYRLSVLDNRLRKQRTKRESRLLEKASKLIPVPNLIKTNEKTNSIEMDFIPGLKLSDNLDSLSDNQEICKIIGKKISILHDNNIIHGDLTTSNMIYVDNRPLTNKSKRKLSNTVEPIDVIANDDSPNSQSFKVYFIDFGLSFESSKAEDKAVDLHLIKQALEAKHFNNYHEFWNSILEGYKSSKHFKETIKRLESVEKRGRYKKAY